MTPRFTGEGGLGLWSALAPPLFVLFQGVYWLSARTWVATEPMPRLFAMAYHGLGVLNPVKLAAGLLSVLRWMPGVLGSALAIVAVWLFGMLEHLNCFVVRLSYPLRRWFQEVHQWRTPRLETDLRQASS